jgi:hypothetical protein
VSGEEQAAMGRHLQPRLQALADKDRGAGGQAESRYIATLHHGLKEGHLFPDIARPYPGAPQYQVILAAQGGLLVRKENGRGSGYVAIYKNRYSLRNTV